MEIMLITPSKSKDNNQQREINTVIQLFEAGLDTLHLYKPKMSTKSMRAYIKQIPSQFYNRIIIHSHHNLAFEFQLKGIHFTREHLKRTFRNWLIFQKEKWYQRTLVHTRTYKKLSDIYNEEKYRFDYYLLYDVFNRVTNDFNIGYHPIRLKEMKTIEKKLVARGGINLITAQKAKAEGFYGICLNSFIWNSEQPLDNFLAIKEALNE